MENPTQLDSGKGVADFGSAASSSGAIPRELKRKQYWRDRKARHKQRAANRAATDDYSSSGSSEQEVSDDSSTWESEPLPGKGKGKKRNRGIRRSRRAPRKPTVSAEELKKQLIDLTAREAGARDALKEIREERKLAAAAIELVRMTDFDVTIVPNDPVSFGFATALMEAANFGDMFEHISHYLLGGQFENIAAGLDSVWANRMAYYTESALNMVGMNAAAAGAAAVSARWATSAISDFFTQFGPQTMKVSLKFGEIEGGEGDDDVRMPCMKFGDIKLRAGITEVVISYETTRGLIITDDPMLISSGLVHSVIRSIERSSDPVLALESAVLRMGRDGSVNIGAVHMSRDSITENSAIVAVWLYLRGRARLSSRFIRNLRLKVEPSA